MTLVPNSAPEGIKILLQQCWSTKPRNRPSFGQILKHLDIVSGSEVLLKFDDEYLKSQKSWQEEVKEKMSIKLIETSGAQLYNMEEDLIQKRKEELKHATDIRELYEKKLEKANNLYFELSTVLLQLDQRERELVKREKALNIRNEKIVRPILRREFLEKNKAYSTQSTKQSKPDQTIVTEKAPPDEAIDEPDGQEVAGAERPPSVDSLESYKGDELAKLSEAENVVFGEKGNVVFRQRSVDSRHSSRQNSTPDSFSVAQVADQGKIQVSRSLILTKRILFHIIMTLNYNFI